MEELGWRFIGGQALSLVALALCIAAFSSKRDDRLLFILISANVAFTLHFMLLGGWTAAAVTALIVVRIALARHYKGSWPIALMLLVASCGAAVVTWQGPLDTFALVAAILGTIAMFLLTGIPMRLVLAGAALAWLLNNLLLASIGGVIAEALILATNLITIRRMVLDRRLLDADDRPEPAKNPLGTADGRPE